VALATPAVHRRLAASWSAGTLSAGPGRSTGANAVGAAFAVGAATVPAIASARASPATME